MEKLKDENGVVVGMVGESGQMTDSMKKVFQDMRKGSQVVESTQSLSDIGIDTEALVYGFRENHTEAKVTEVVITDEIIDTGLTPPLISCKGGSTKKSGVSMFPNGTMYDEYGARIPLTPNEAVLLNKFRSK